jgi:hypothetical protein
MRLFFDNRTPFNDALDAKVVVRAEIIASARLLACAKSERQILALGLHDATRSDPTP